MATLMTVFLSSTARDLRPYRDAVAAAIAQLDGYRCVRMEDFGALDGSVEEFIRAKVAACDIFVGLVGHLHGSRPEGSELSFTEVEYETAKETHKTCLMFLAQDDFALPVSLREPDEAFWRQARLRERIREEGLVTFFDEPQRLAVLVVAALHEERTRLGSLKSRGKRRVTATAATRRRIFICYRRKTTQGDAGRISDRLVRIFGRAQVFRDVDSIPLGTDFIVALDERIATCDVVLAVFGPGWASDSRLQDSEDYVRRELSSALRGGIPVLPVLVQGATMPDPSELPEELREVCRRNSLSIIDQLFDASLKLLTRTIRELPYRSSEEANT